MHMRIVKRWAGLGILAVALALAGCSSDGQFHFLGYSTVPNYDPSIHTVYVAIAKNITFQRELEDYLTRAVIREINTKTPMRTVSSRDGADTELTLKIVTVRKNMLISTPDSQVRQAELGLGVQVVWLDLRPGRLGEVLSNRRPALPQEPPLPGMEQRPPDLPLPVLLMPAATYEPELGGSNATGNQQMIDRLAVQIASMMEKSW